MICRFLCKSQVDFGKIYSHRSIQTSLLLLVLLYLLCLVAMYVWHSKFKGIMISYTL